MLAKRIIPCLDVNNGRVVKGVNFINLRDAGDPVEAAIYYDKQKADELVFLDITASHQKRKTMIDVVRKVAESIFMPFTVGGGINSIDDIRNLLKAGCDKISINTAAVKDPQLIKKASSRFGSQCIVVAIDAKRCQAPKKVPGTFSWQVYINGGRTSTGKDAVKWAKQAEKLGAGEILLTSMDCDGTKDGYDIELTKTISTSVNIPVIASGGAGNLEHLYQALTKGCADAVLAASIFHYREYSIKQAKDYLIKRKVLVRA
ncbi:MAG: imidazole glycerol phosphate synthase subunit HisF [Candidatus Omnitrophica bacterium CG12_big_fil_rev_8_21_14_0_65_43_15]|uniref:Imidazole glycerol phosphate synthase subunit HisF n=1 Tax=Candidatus Taenaricola geysiri TaxID=1974752 RepID=A0A2J0LF64_9BACT|nr:MAG: imidazole glycerol phosphate synthase subunit HisF [Candidatus Omnitrophica bacterium CG1_02_43_210]PIV12061.1 MAG: imidazole glycerol phosphate synthase subunit HisF [Candidatus Omnitrophica bacterium CG03_land_8_20_14_0_80_43_22]PIW66481.1 MAG: imidazole glycerol phosphate synthase subunit HisF [Candidatus Omnitrophica bacterium CG12_big_fil_rev_8_21_14_0_65_43_15]PIW80007.1 MAG: imidazole glycerol phosphate synthase subunit HisF [Candidatus Omnitrophica bacterium CG_4_8_14_3_um_filter